MSEQLPTTRQMAEQLVSNVCGSMSLEGANVSQQTRQELIDYAEARLTSIRNGLVGTMIYGDSRKAFNNSSL